MNTIAEDNNAEVIRLGHVIKNSEHCILQLCNLLPHHGPADIQNKHCMLWQLLKIFRSKEMNKISINDLNFTVLALPIHIIPHQELTRNTTFSSFLKSSFVRCVNYVSIFSALLVTNYSIFAFSFFGKI